MKVKMTITALSIAVVAASSVAYSAYKEEIDGALATPYCWATVERVESLLKKKAPIEKINKVKGRADSFCSAEVPDSLKAKHKRMNERLFKRLAAIETNKIYEQARRKRELDRLRHEAVIKERASENPPRSREGDAGVLRAIFEVAFPVEEAVRDLPGHLCRAFLCQQVL